MFVLCTAITANAGYITQSGTFSNGGTWKIEGSTLYIDAEEVMIDGVIYILRDGKIYNILGTEVR